MSSAQRHSNDDTQSTLTAPIATPHWGSQTGSAFSIRATTTTIHASSESVLEILLNTNNYPRWNDFVPRVKVENSPGDDGSPASDGRLRQGVLFTEYVDMFGQGKPSGIIRIRLLMSTLKGLEDKRKGFRVAWLGKGFPDWALRCERVHEIVEEKEGEVIYDVWETFSGPLAILIKIFVGKVLVRRFAQWNRDLKSFAEGRDKGEDGGAVEQ
ncbi:MAG: hypothetical protein Q9163_000743 [Psora crenata]